MNIFIILGIVIANAIALAFIYQFVKKMPKKDKLIFIAASFAVNYMLILLVYTLSGIGMNASIHSSAEAFVTYVFVPVNVILFVPFLAFSYVKMKEKKLKPENFIKRVIIMFVVIIVVLVLEFFNYRSVQNNIEKINQDQTKQNGQMQEQENVQENKDMTNTVQNIIGNEVTNETSHPMNQNQTSQGNQIIRTNTITNTQINTQKD